MTKALTFVLLAALNVMAVRPAVAAGTGFLRFWWSEGNIDDGQFNGVEDRENFFPALLNIKPFVDAWAGKGVEFRLKGNGSVDLAWTDISRHDVWALYRSDEVMSGESFSTAIDRASVVNLDQTGIVIPSGVIARIRRGDDVVMACEIRPGARSAF